MWASLCGSPKLCEQAPDFGDNIPEGVSKACPYRVVDVHVRRSQASRKCQQFVDVVFVTRVNSMAESFVMSCSVPCRVAMPVTATSIGAAQDSNAISLVLRQCCWSGWKQKDSRLCLPVGAGAPNRLRKHDSYTNILGSLFMHIQSEGNDVFLARHNSDPM